MTPNSKLPLTIVAFICAATLTSSPSLANGRFPRAERLIEHPSDPNKITVVATYGILVTDDRTNWYHDCETAFAFQTAYTGDPLAALLPDESLLVGTDSILAISHDHGCDWTKSLELPSGFVNDISTAPSKPNTIVALVTTLTGGMPTLRIRESTDGAATWQEIGTSLPIMTGYTLDVDPADPNHIYVTGVKDVSDSVTPALLLTSTDHAMTWTEHPIPNTSALDAPYIARIHPTDPNKIFVRVDSWKNRDVVETANDALLYSSDGGKNWTELIHPGGTDPDTPGAKLLGFALSPDGTTVLAGYGDPVDGSRLVDRTFTGVYRSSSDGKYTFSGTPEMPDPPIVDDLVSCITWTKNGIYVCFSLDGRPQYVSFAKDVNFTAASLTKIFTVADTKGVPRCCNGRAVTTCNWSLDCLPLGACSDAGMSPQPVAGATCSPDAGAGGKGGGDGGTASGGAKVTPANDKPGCGCRVTAPARGSELATAGVVVAFALVLRRRRSSRRRG